MALPMASAGASICSARLAPWPSRYRAISPATSPATVSVRKAASDSTLARHTHTAAATGPRKASGTVVHRARMASASTLVRPQPAAAPRARASAAAAAPSSAPATCLAQPVRPAQPVQPAQPIQPVRPVRPIQPRRPSATMPVNHDSRHSPCRCSYCRWPTRGRASPGAVIRRPP